VHPRHTSINHARSAAAGVRSGGVYLLENRGAGSSKQVPNFQDNFDIDY
jgi:hypothetical protein